MSDKKLFMTLLVLLIALLAACAPGQAAQPTTEPAPEKDRSCLTTCRVDVLVSTEVTASLNRGTTNSLLPTPRTSRFPFRSRRKSIPVTARSKSLGFRIRRST